MGDRGHKRENDMVLMGNLLDAAWDMVRKGRVSKLNVGIERAKGEERVELVINWVTNGLKYMVVNAFIDIELWEWVKSLLMLSMFWQQRMIWKNRQKMHCPEDGIQMNDGSEWLTVRKVIWLYNIHASGISVIQCTNVHGYFTLSRVNEKTRCVQTTSRPWIPHVDESSSVSSGVVLTNNVSKWPGEFFHLLIAWMCSHFIPPIPDRSLGAKKLATMDMWTVIFL